MMENFNNIEVASWYVFMSDYIDEIIAVLGEITGIIEDFYIVSLQFDKMAAYCGDGDCMVFYKDK